MPDQEDIDAIEDALIENATGPLRAQGDTGSIEQHPLPDQIAADKYVKTAQASRTGMGGVRMFKFVPPGTV